MEYYAAKRKKELLPLMRAWMELESIILSDISQVVKDKYHHDLTYKWNIINKTNKRVKYNQRHGNKEQMDSDQRGRGKGVMREKGKSRQGACIKDPWTKTTVRGGLKVGGGGGWGRGGWRGKNGNNCN